MSNRLAQLRNSLTKNPPTGGLDAILITSVSNITYLTDYSGFSKEEREAYLLIVNQPHAQPQGLTHKTPGVIGYILTDGRYSEAIKKLIPDFKLIEISSKNSVEKILKNLKNKHKIKKLGFEGHNISFLEHKKLLSCFNDLNHFSLNNLRTIKDGDEISKIEKACQLGDKTFNYILKKIKLGVSEKEIANEIEFFIRKNGADISFPPIVAFGANSATPHHVPTHNSKLLTSNSIVLLDFGVKLNNYCSDMTRTVFFGQPTTKQKRMYQTVLEAQSRALNLLNSLFIIHDSIPARKIDKVARDYILSKGYPTIPHSLGHGIGIDVHEFPRISPKSKDILKNGMVFSVEPGIYIPGFGGVRIEGLVVLEKGKLRMLTNSPRNLLTIG